MGNTKMVKEQKTAVLSFFDKGPALLASILKLVSVEEARLIAAKTNDLNERRLLMAQAIVRNHKASIATT